MLYNQLLPSFSHVKIKIHYIKHVNLFTTCWTLKWINYADVTKMESNNGNISFLENVWSFKIKCCKLQLKPKSLYPKLYFYIYVYRFIYFRILGWIKFMLFHLWMRMRQVYCPDWFYRSGPKFIINNFKNIKLA